MNPTYPVGTIAKLLMLTERRVNQLAKEGIIPKSERGRYELAPAIQGYIRWLKDKASPNISGDAVDYHSEKTRKLKAEADLAEMAASKRKGELLEADQVQQAWINILVELKTNMLNNLPARISQATIGLDDDTEIKNKVLIEIREALDVVSGIDIDDLLKDDEEGGEENA